MTSINEKIIDQIWDSFTPFLTTARVIGAVLFCLFLTSGNSNLLDHNFLTLTIKDTFSLVSETLKNAENWKIGLGVISALVLAPLISNKAIKIFIEKVHIHLAFALVDEVTKIQTTQDPEVLKTYLVKRNAGIGLIGKLKSVGELWTLLFIAIIFFFFSSIPSWLEIALIPILLIFVWLLGVYLLSQRILIIFLTKIAPFNKMAGTM